MLLTEKLIRENIENDDDITHELLLLQKGEDLIQKIEANSLKIKLPYQSITKMDATLSGMGNITSLILDNNCIKKIEALETLYSLRHLDLSFNYIEVIEGLESLSDLNFLSLLHNKISKVEGIKKCTNLLSLSLGDNHIKSLKNDNSEIGELHHLIKLRDLNMSGNHLVEDARSTLIQSLPSLKYFNNVKISNEERLTNTLLPRHASRSKTYLLQAQEVMEKEGIESEDLLAQYKKWDEQLTLLESKMEQALKEMTEKINNRIHRVMENMTEGIPSVTAINDEVILARNISDMISTTNSTFDETIGKITALNAQTFQTFDEHIQQNDGYDEQVKLIMTQRTTLFKDQIASYLNAYESISMKHHRERMLSFKPK